jgi:hypothetical protein
MIYIYRYQKWSDSLLPQGVAQTDGAAVLDAAANIRTGPPASPSHPHWDGTQNTMRAPAARQPGW